MEKENGRNIIHAPLFCLYRTWDICKLATSNLLNSLVVLKSKKVHAIVAPSILIFIYGGHSYKFIFIIQHVFFFFFWQMSLFIFAQVVIFSKLSYALDRRSLYLGGFPIGNHLSLLLHVSLYVALEY